VVIRSMGAGNTVPVSIVMVGIGGYGHFYLKILLEEFPPGAVELRGAVDPSPEKSGLHDELLGRRIPIFSALEEFYGAGMTTDLAVISSPLHFHVPQSILALENGSHVLCDKPLGVTVQEGLELIRRRDSTGRWVRIGYQWCYSSAIQALKRDIIDGLFGKPVRFKTLCFWPRERAYYQRNDWAGRRRDPSGRLVLDSPANNAMAHFLHNLLYLLGDKPHLSIRPVEATAELYRAYPIENFDTAACRVITTDGVELLFYASHVTDQTIEPTFNLEFEGAVVSFREKSEEIIAIFKSGAVKQYGSPDADHQFRKLFEAVAAVNETRPIVCGPEAALPQTICINGLQEYVTQIAAFPEAMISWSGDGARLLVDGLGEALLDSYRNNRLPGELGYPWAVKGKAVDLKEYIYYPGGKPPEREG
jgi:predicted dehydrogenase